MAYNTITLKGTPVRGEAVANAAITPGQLIERMSTDKLRRHASAGQNATRMFALEDELQGNDIDTNYAASAIVQFGVFKPGDEVYSFLANGETAVIGSWLESDGNGDLRVHTADSAGAVEYPEAIIGVAREALDMSGSSGVDPASRRIRVEII